MELDKLKIELKKYLKDDERRYVHSIGVMEMSEKLALKYGEDPERCKRAGLMHDMAKVMSNKDKLKYVEENNIEVTETEKIVPGILHGKIAADLCKKNYKFDDEMCSAIAYHTTGKPGMTMLEKIIYVADTVEENRNYRSVNYYRDLAFKDIDQALLEIINFVISDNIKKDKVIIEKSIETRNFILINHSK